MHSSGQKDKSVVIVTQSCFYGGSILIGMGTVASLRIYKCKDVKKANADNMVGELSVPAVEGAMAVDPVLRGILCSNGLCAVLEGTAKYHVRGSDMPY